MNPYLRVIQALNQGRITYIVVGGFAAVLHGNNRFTADLDLVVELTPQHARLAIETLSSLGFKSRLPVDPLSFADNAIRDAWVREKGMIVFSMFDETTPTLTVDLFAQYPIDFDRLLRNSVLLDVAGVSVRACGIDDLIQMKSETGRPVDALDVANLRIIQARQVAKDQP